MEKVEPGEVPGDDLEHLFDELRHICDTLESGRITLEESLTLYARGTEIEIKIKRIINSAERRIVQVINKDGTLTPFDAKR